MNYDEALIVLGLTPENCTLATLKKAYAQGAKAHRPETDPEGFANIRLAYERVQEALKAHTQDETQTVLRAANDHRFAANDASYSVAQPYADLLSDIARSESLDLNQPIQDAILEQHRQEVLLLNQAWLTFLPAFMASAPLTEADRVAPQMAALNTLLQAKALDHYLTRQTLGEKLGWLLLHEAGEWVCLDALKRVMKTFAYETYGWHNHSWTQHSLLEAKSDTLREKMIFQLNAKQENTTEYRLSHPMSTLSFAKLWFFKRAQTKLLKARLSTIQKKHTQWTNILHPTQVWRVESWPSTIVQLICCLFGLVSVPLIYLAMAYINNHWLTADTAALPVVQYSKPNHGLLKAAIDVVAVVGGAIGCALIYMAMYTHIGYRVKKHHQNFTKDIILDNTDDQDNKNTIDIQGIQDIQDIQDITNPINTISGGKAVGNKRESIQLNFAQRCYKACRQTFTLNFFGALEAIAVLILLILLPWQKIHAFSPMGTQLYSAMSMIVALFSFIYLKYLSKRQRVAPNHPYLCAIIIMAGFYLLQSAGGISSTAMLNPKNMAVENPAKWIGLTLFSIFVRSQFPSFIRVDWSQTIPHWLVFNRFAVLEKTAIKILSAMSIMSILVTLGMLSLGNEAFFKTTPIITSIMCLLVYLWLIINADMDTPVMTTPIKITTLVASMVLISIKNYYPINAYIGISIFDWICSVLLLISMSWYWTYGFYQKYFDRWVEIKNKIPQP